MLESLLISSADCHGNHTGFSMLVLKIGQFQIIGAS